MDVAHMSFFPDGFDPRDEAVGLLDLVAIDTPDGTFRFWLGQDGLFDDVNGNRWYGSQVFEAGDLEFSIGGTAPEGRLSMAFYQAEGAPELVAEVLALGADYVRGREIRFYVQPLRSHAEFYAPHFAPILWKTGKMTAIDYQMQGLVERSISLAFETALAGRNAARNFFYTTEDHARLVGAPNPSLSVMPRANDRPEKLFG